MVRLRKSRFDRMRNGGFRPMVFMGHGLLAAFFMMTSVLAATALWRSAIKLGPLSASVATPYLGLVLLLCKSMGATLNAIGGFLRRSGSSIQSENESGDEHERIAERDSRKGAQTKILSMQK